MITDPKAASESAFPWSEDYPPGIPIDFEFPDVALTRFLNDAARDFPHAAALQGATWGHLHAAVGRLAMILHEQGLQAGGHVVVITDAARTHVALALAGWHCGATVTLLDRELSDPPIWADTVPSLVVGAKAKSVRRRLGLKDAAALDVGDGAWLRPTRKARMGFGARVRKAPPLLRDTAIDSSSAALHFADTGQTWTHRQAVAAAFQARLWIPDVRAGLEVINLGASDAQPFGAAWLLMAVLSAASINGAATGSQAAAALRSRPTLIATDRRGLNELLQSPDLLHASTRLRLTLVEATALPAATMEAFEAATAGARLRPAWAHPQLGGAVLAMPPYGRHRGDATGLPTTGTAVRTVDGELRITTALSRLAGHDPVALSGRVEPDGMVVVHESET